MFLQIWRIESDCSVNLPSGSFEVAGPLLARHEEFCRGQGEPRFDFFTILNPGWPEKSRGAERRIPACPRRPFVSWPKDRAQHSGRESELTVSVSDCVRQDEKERNLSFQENCALRNRRTRLWALLYMVRIKMKIILALASPQIRSRGENIHLHLLRRSFRRWIGSARPTPEQRFH